MEQDINIIKTNIGKNLLETITSALYEDPIILFREYVQNSVDAYKMASKQAKKDLIPDFKVNIDIAKEDKRIIIKDNGYGIDTTEEFVKKMVSFGMSDKRDRTEYIGFRGIGRISAMPFCETLIFRNKAAGSDTVNVCKWKGAKYRELLNFNTDDYQSFDDIVRGIIDIFDEKANVPKEAHYFEVVIEEYGQEIDEVINRKNFEQRLKMLLPLKYSNEFASAMIIIEKYNDFMGEDLNDFMYSIFLNGKELRKNYTEKYILDSKIVFWELREKPGTNNRPGGKMGILWFTFNRKITSNQNDTDYGILVRSKNILMGNNDTFADQTLNSKEYVTTYRELAQELRGIYGELLINSSNLRDNARREWFKTDENSIYLKHIIVDFMRRLHNYRYSASKFFNKKEDDNKMKLKQALVDLIDADINSIEVNNFYDEEKDTTKTTDKGNVNVSKGGSGKSHKNNSTGMQQSPVYHEEEANSKDNPEGHQSSQDSDKEKTLADEDIPRESQTKKQFYNELLKLIQEYFEKEKQYDIFLKLRAYIKNHYNK